MPMQRPETTADTQISRLEDIPDEEMLDASDTFESNFVPRSFLPGPGLSPEDAFHQMAVSAGKKLEEAGIPISNQAGVSFEDRDTQAKESDRRTRIDGQAAPAERDEANNFEVAEALTILVAGYFHPGMSDLKQRQLAAILSVYDTQEQNNNSPGAASTSSSYPIC